MSTAERPTGPVLSVVLGVVLLMAAIGLFGGVISVMTGVGKGDSGGSQNFAAQFAGTYTFAFGAAALFLWMKYRERRSFINLGFWNDQVGYRIGRGMLIGIAMTSVVVLSTALVGQATFGSANFSALLPTGLLLIGFLIQGSTEEIFGRGLVLQGVALKWGVPIAMTVQTIYFSLMHGANPGVGLIPLVNLILVGVFLGFWALAENSLWGVCAFHGFWNWSLGNFWGSKVSGQEIQTAFLQFRPTEGASDLLTGGAFGAEGSLITTLVLAAGTAIAYRAYRRDRAARRAVAL
ncbi:CPBP family intramembrane glutamic endopeptidase [Austwickia chelonae]|uniref:CPBP family intramembrane glutamic endopeptidase n=1 Tax=Austwickia chelonae TaxID=100225 RepID=UPI0013C2A7C8|nr:type II CAAX endopeptidase family protein [Austwickia chelonae]